MIRKGLEQEKIAEQLRIEMSKSHNDKDISKITALNKASGIKTTGMTTFDLLTEIMCASKRSVQEINTLHTAMVSKMQMDVPIFTILDGSNSMRSILEGGVSCLDVALCIALTFMITNPEDEFRSSLMWFGSETSIHGKSKFSNSAPNGYLSNNKKYLKESESLKIVDPKLTFKENLKTLSDSNPHHVSSTNIGACIETFIKLVTSGAMNVEQLPKCLLFITDNESNDGRKPMTAKGEGFLQISAQIGWMPLIVFWSLNKTSLPINEYKDANNVIILSGYNESTLTSLLQCIKKGSLNVYDTLYAVNDHPQFNLIRN